MTDRYKGLREYFDIYVNLSPERSSPSILDEAKRLVHGDRQRDYSHPSVNFTRIATIWSALLDTEVTAEDVARCMIGLKLARDCARPKRDNASDIAGYAECLEMVREEEE